MAREFFIFRRPWQVWAAQQGALTTLFYPAHVQPMWMTRDKLWSVHRVAALQPDGETLRASAAASPWGPLGRPLYIRESFATRWDLDQDLAANPTHPETLARARHYLRYKADRPCFNPLALGNVHGYGRGYRGPNSMPRWAARLAVTVTAVDYVKLPGLSSEVIERAGIRAWERFATDVRYAPADHTGKAPAWAWDDCPDSPAAAFARAWDDLHPAHPAHLDRWTLRATVTCGPDAYGCALDE